VRTLWDSSLAAWERCGYRFYLEKILRLPEEPIIRPAGAQAAPALDPRTRGSLVHALLEHPGAATGERVADVAAGHGITLTPAEAADVARLTDAFERSPLAARIARARRVHREQGFAVALGDTLLTGVVDVLASERGATQLVVDYKTDALADGEDLEAFVGEHYGVQRRVYALAVLRAGAPRVEVAYALLERPGEPVTTTYAADQAAVLETELLALASRMLAGEYPVTARPHRELCESCPGRRALCSHPEALTLSERSRPDVAVGA
jgi:RecB family exonuclease